MREYNQGDTYTEYEEDDELDLDYDESAEDVEAKVTTLWGMPLKTVILGGAVILCVLVGMLMFSTRKKEDPTEEFVTVDVPATEEVITNEPEVITEPEEQLVYDEVTQQWVPESELQTEVVVTVDELSTEEQVTLRKLGYSGDEIKVALANGFDVQGLVDAATALHDSEASEALVRMSDSASEEFRWIVDNTYFSQEGWEFVSYEDALWGSYIYTHESFIVNADYVKCPTYGAQLQLKCHVTDDLDVFYIVTPERFASLPERGNIVLQIDYTIYGENLYVTNITETDNTLDSIDSSAITQTDLIAEEQPVDEADTPVSNE